MRQRDIQPELMDDPELPRDQHQRALVGLARLNTFSGVSGALYGRIRRLAMLRPSRSLRLLDVASGSADLPIAWARRAKRDSIHLEITTVDVSPTAADQQRAAADAAGVSITAVVRDCLAGDLPDGFDLVTCSLFMHHLQNHQAFGLLQSMQRATSGAIMVCDLDRSRLNLAMVSAAARVLTRSPIVHFDSAASVRAAFTRSEFGKLAGDALARPVTVHRLFPCRFVMTAEEQTAAITETAVAFA